MVRHRHAGVGGNHSTPNAMSPAPCAGVSGRHGMTPYFTLASWHRRTAPVPSFPQITICANLDEKMPRPPTIIPWRLRRHGILSVSRHTAAGVGGHIRRGTVCLAIGAPWNDAPTSPQHNGTGALHRCHHMYAKTKQPITAQRRGAAHRPCPCLPTAGRHRCDQSAHTPPSGGKWGGAT